MTTLTLSALVVASLFGLNLLKVAVKYDYRANSSVDTTPLGAVPRILECHCFPSVSVIPHLPIMSIHSQPAILASGVAGYENFDGASRFVNNVEDSHLGETVSETARCDIEAKRLLCLLMSLVRKIRVY